MFGVIASAVSVLSMATGMDGAQRYNPSNIQRHDARPEASKGEHYNRAKRLGSRKKRSGAALTWLGSCCRIDSSATDNREGGK